jgi:hypothetical protein
MISVIVSVLSAVPWASNGHYYEFSATFLSFESARVYASNRTYLGMKGYVATITSAAEASFVGGLYSGTAIWIGARYLGDTAAPVQWFWTDGPEAGQVR